MQPNITSNNTAANNQDIVLYQSGDGAVEFHVNVFNETVWLTQKQMAQLFGVTIKTISEHTQNVFNTNELAENAVIRKFRITAADGKNYKTQHYNLDAIISVGYRVKSSRATQFRQWATKVLKQYMLQGYVINETRLGNIEANLNALLESNKSHQQAQQLTAERIRNIEQDLNTIKTLLLKAADRPINISINNQLGSPKLEDKLIELLDKVINSLQVSEVKQQLEDIKQDIAAAPNNKTAKNRLMKFFNDMGDSNSSAHKAIKGAGIAKGIITEIVKLIAKIKELM
jgi:AraC-like DNA-binding protein